MLPIPEINLYRVLEKSIALVRNEIQGAVVYLDAWSSESFCLSIGSKTILEMGALNVHRLDKVTKRDALIANLLTSASHEEDKTPPVVVFLSQLLQQAMDQVLNLIELHQNAKHFLIYCMYSADIHSQLLDQTFQQNAYANFKSQIVSSYKYVELEVRYFPWICATITPGSFILTPHEESLLGFGLDHSKATIKEHAIKRMSQALVGFAGHLGYKLDVFTLGSDSFTIGHEVMKMGSPISLEGNPPDKTASLVLIDRSLDLLSPLLHPDALIDHLLHTLHLHESSAATRLMDLSVQLDSKTKIPILAREPEDLNAFCQHLMGRTVRDGSMYIRKWIREEFRSHGLKTEYKNKPGPPTSQEFQKAAETLQQMPNGAKIEALRTLAIAAKKALDPEEGKNQWETLSANENQIMALSSTSEDLVQYFLDLIQNISKPEAIFNVIDACSLLTVAYSVLLDEGDEPFNPTEEKLIMETMVQCCMQLKDTSFVGDQFFSHSNLSRQKAELRSALHHRIQICKQILTTRNVLQQLRKLTSKVSGEPTPLLLQLASMILQNKSITDAQHPITSLQGRLLQTATAAGGGLLSKGLGKLGLGKQDNAVGGHDLAIIFVVGGISLYEIQSVSKELEASGKTPWKTKILVGGSVLTDQLNLVKNIWAIKK